MCGRTGAALVLRKRACLPAGPWPAACAGFLRAALSCGWDETGTRPEVSGTCTHRWSRPPELRLCDPLTPVASQGFLWPAEGGGAQSWVRAGRHSVWTQVDQDGGGERPCRVVGLWAVGLAGRSGGVGGGKGPFQGHGVESRERHTGHHGVDTGAHILKPTSTPTGTCPPRHRQTEALG